MMSIIKRWLYPIFECEDCIGMIHYGCQCAYYEAIAPNTPPTKFIEFLRKWIKKMIDSFAEITASSIIESAKEKTEWLKNEIDKDKEAWFSQERQETKRYGFLKLKSRQLTEDEVLDNWKYSYYAFSGSPYYEIETSWNSVIRKFKGYIDLAENAISNGNGLVNLSLDDNDWLFTSKLETRYKGYKNEVSA